MVQGKTQQLLEVCNLSANTVHGVPLISNATLSLQAGQVGVLLGANGAGKSSLLKAISTILPAQSGAVAIDGRAVTSFESAGLGYVLERPEMQGISDSVSGEMDTVLSWHRATLTAHDRNWLMQVFDLGALQNRPPSSLSAGELQRLNVAVSLAPRPRCLLLDDPFVYLDSDAARKGWLAIREAVNTGWVGAVLLAAHDVDCAAEADCVGVMKDGKLISWGPPEEVLELAVQCGHPPTFASRLASRLREQGWVLDTAGLTPESLAQAILDEAQ